MNSKLSLNTVNLEAILEAVNNLPNGAEDTNLSDATATSEEIFKDKTAYTSKGKVTGTFTIEEELTTQENLITQIQNVVDNLPEAKEDLVLQNKTVTPTVSSQTIVADSGYDGLNSVTVSGDENLVAENIVSGVSIFGVTGNATSGDSNNGEVGGVCSSLTINLENITCDTIAYSTNNNYIVQNSPANETILTNIDINQPIFMCLWGELLGNIQVINSGNIEFVASSGGSGGFVFKCTSSEAATLTLYDGE